VYGRPVEYGTAVDWWALGVLVFEMLTGMPPFFDEQPNQQFRNICEEELEFPSLLDDSPGARDFISGLLERGVANRLGSQGGAPAVKAHAFFTSVDFEALLLRDVPAPWVPDQETIYVEPSVWQSAPVHPNQQPPPPPEGCCDSTQTVARAVDMTSSTTTDALSNRMANVSLFQGFSYTASSLASVTHVAASPPPNHNNQSMSGCGSLSGGGHTPVALYHKRRGQHAITASPPLSNGGNSVGFGFTVGGTSIRSDKSFSGGVSPPAALALGGSSLGSLALAAGVVGSGTAVGGDGDGDGGGGPDDDEHDVDLQGTFSIELDDDDEDNGGVVLDHGATHVMHPQDLPEQQQQHGVTYAPLGSGGYDEPFDFEL
jgi:hypothetical protein